MGGIVNEQVIAVGDNRGKVMEEAYNKTKRKVMFVSEVGFEDRVLRIRQISTGELDYNYYPAAPIIKTPVSDIVQTLHINIDFILDTGADLTIIHNNEDAVKLNLFDAPNGFGYFAGIRSKPEERQLYGAIVNIAGQKITVAVDCRDDIDENLLGRDVINEFELTVCAKREFVQLKCISA